MVYSLYCPFCPTCHPACSFSVHIAKAMADRSQKNHIGQLKVIRDDTAHGVRSEISEKEFEKKMLKLRNIAINLFKSYEGMAQEWKENFQRYRHISEKVLPALLKKYESWSKDIMEVMIAYLFDNNWVFNARNSQSLT